MITKTRTYTQLNSSTYEPGGSLIPQTQIYERIETRSSPRGTRIDNPCYHLKLVAPGEYIHRPKQWYSPNACLLSFVHALRDNIREIAKRPLHIGLDFQNNNSFELIPFLFDMDDTIAMFSKKFIKEISYGAVTWGVFPFVSDVKSLASTVSDINGGLAASYEKVLAKRITRRFPFTEEIDDGIFRYTVSGVSTLSGYLVGDCVLPNGPLDALGILADEIGLNVDLKTVWDVIPLSFALDYIVPVGDILESLHPRGWFSPTFSLERGLFSYKADITQVAYADGRSCSLQYTMFAREPAISMVLPSRPPVMPQFKAPDAREIFNIGYLVNGRVSRS